MPYSVMVCKTCELLTDESEHGREDEHCEAPDGFERIKLFTAHEIRRRLDDVAPDYGSEHCTCGSHGTPWVECPVHWATAALERAGMYT